MPQCPGADVLDRLVIEFQARYPDLKVHLVQSERFVDLVEEGIDVAVRVGQLTDSTLVASRLGASRRVVVGTPEYFRAQGCTTDPPGPGHHNCILYTYLPSGNVWQFQARRANCGARLGHVPHDERKAPSARQCSPASASPRRRYGWCTITCGRVASRRSLPEYAPLPVDINAVYPSSRHVATKVRVFIDFLKEAFGRVPELN